MRLVAVILFDSHFHEDGVSIHQHAACLVKKVRRRGETRENVSQPDLSRRILIREGLKESSAQQFHIFSGIVTIILNPVELQKLAADLIVDKLPVRRILRVERGQRCLAAEHLAPMRVDAALLRDSGSAYIVEQRVELNCLAALRIVVLVVPSLRRPRRRQRQRLVNEHLAKLGELRAGLDCSPMRSGGVGQQGSRQEGKGPNRCGFHSGRPV